MGKFGDFLGITAGVEAVMVVFKKFGVGKYTVIDKNKIKDAE